MAVGALALIGLAGVASSVLVAMGRSQDGNIPNLVLKVLRHQDPLRERSFHASCLGAVVCSMQASLFHAILS